MVTESLLAVVGPTTFVVRKLNGEGIECAMPRHRGATVADIIWNLTSTDPIHFNLIGTCLGGSRGLTIPQDTSLDRIDYALPLTLVPQLVGAAPKRRLGFAHPTSSSSSPGPASKPLSAFFAPVTPAQAPATPRLTWVHDLTQTAQSARIGAPLLHDVRGKVTLKAAGLAEGTLHIEYIDKETEYVEREEVDAKTPMGRALAGGSRALPRPPRRGLSGQRRAAWLCAAPGARLNGMETAQCRVKHCRV